jgi:radical SAM superfamily enzyme YgiQ (UPF0313 family)
MSESKHQEILLVGVNAGYIHSALGLRCVLVNMRELQGRTAILETDSQESTPTQLVERILRRAPRVVGFSVYIWNVEFVQATLRLLRVCSPELGVVLGGPELVASDLDQSWLELADAIVCGEAEEVAQEVFERVARGERRFGIVEAPPPDLRTVALPYELYEDADLASRVVYLESTRGCPMHCEYCSSAGGSGIRPFPLDRLLPAFERLIARGARNFKFLDRSFNLNGDHGLAVLDFFLDIAPADVGLHLEFVPHSINAAWRERLLRFPPQALHIEVGVQTLNPEVGLRIRRPINRDAISKMLNFLTEEAQASVHADLIAGLPGEDWDSIAAGFNWLLAQRPAELQFGILKRLPGTAIGRHAAEFGMRYAPDPPYEILCSDQLPFAQMRRLVRFARCWELLHNRPRFREACLLLCNRGESAFDEVMAVADWVEQHYGRLHALAPKQIAKALQAVAGDEYPEVRAAIERGARKAARQG